VLPGLYDQLTGGPQLPFRASQGVLVERRDGLIAVHRPNAAQPEAGEVVVERL